MHSVILAAAIFLACAVEMVEALTIVLATAVTRGWHSVRYAIAAALLALAAIVAVLGPALSVLPIDAIRVIVGFLLLAFGLQWLRKAILRAAGYMPLHDEDAIYQRDVEAFGAAPVETRHGIDWYAFTLAFKGVFLEGLEVAIIVVTFGAAHNAYPLAIVSALAAVIIVAVVGVIVHRPLSRVPENTMKFVVGIMLTTFGTFWGAEGAGANWPGGDLWILVLIALYTLVALGLVAMLERRAERAVAIGGAVEDAA
jgi:uncharacterized membrane protein